MVVFKEVYIVNPRKLSLYTVGRHKLTHTHTHAHIHVYTHTHTH